MSSTPVDLSKRDSVRVVRDVLGPMVAQGAIIRRPRVTGWAERRQVDARGRATLTDLRREHGAAPLRLRLGPRTMVLPTDARDVRRLLQDSPVPFTPASKEKRGALRHFQPDGVLISTTSERARRRPFNEVVLDMHEPVHRDATWFTEVVDRETALLARESHQQGCLDWETFSAAFWRVVRTVTLGESARDDVRLTSVLNALRRDANWSSFRPRRPRLRRELESRLSGYVEAATPPTLAARAQDVGDGVDPVGQVPHWLFAFDAAGIAAFRALAVLGARAEERDKVRTEALSPGPLAALLPYTRGVVLESVRLWPTTLVILRDSTDVTRWGEAEVPAGTGFAIVSSFFHRDPQRSDLADAFAPDAWLDGRADDDWGLVPFSGGPVSCPGRNLVLLVASQFLARTAALDLHLPRGRYLAQDPLPLTMDYAGLRFLVP
ncbi:cytochrome P450 [Oerskovia sp. USHLN155]|uniref:cytochrome P450 n=1 Tax=Oerskovia sp. USHLN155 TaxID=3081288 RepID=UPI003016C336